MISVVYRLRVISSSTCLHCRNGRAVHSLLVPSYYFSIQHSSAYSRMAGARLHEHAINFHNTAITSVLPGSMVAGALKRDGDRLAIGDRWYKLQHNVHIVAFGKAVIGMVRAAEDVLGDHIVGGIASVPWGMQDSLKQLEKWYVENVPFPGALPVFCVDFVYCSES